MQISRDQGSKSGVNTSAYDAYHEKARELNELRLRVDEAIRQSHLSGSLVEAQLALNWLLSQTEAFNEASRHYLAELKATLGTNFVGYEEWRAQGFDVGAAAHAPSWINRELLESACPIHPGKLIKDTHILVLIPSRVDVKAYTALLFDELCEAKGGPFWRIINGQKNDWRTQSWARTPQKENQWVLMPKSDPDPYLYPSAPEQHFRAKSLEEQKQVHNNLFSHYREAGALEVMTAAVMHAMVSGYWRMLDGASELRCRDVSEAGSRVSVGFYPGLGLCIDTIRDRAKGFHVGRVLAYVGPSPISYREPDT